MGCLFSKSRSKESVNESPKKEYSWEKRKNINVEDFTLDGLQEKTVVRLPDSIGGQQFLIKDCSKSKIFLLDHTAAITVDNCSECQIITGPIKGSIFLRNCKSCKILCACQQFRTRDCSKTDVFIFCMTQPIIEASYKMRFGCYQLSYEGINKQFKDAGLEIINNTWSSIYDFTPNPEEGPNWGLISENSKIEDIFTLKTERLDNGDGDTSAEEPLNKCFIPESLHLISEPESSIVPMTAGDRGKLSDESCMMLFFHHEDALTTSLKVVNELRNNSIILIKSKQLELSGEQASVMFDSSSQGKYLKAVNRGPVIGLEFNGENCVDKCQNAMETVPDGLLVFMTEFRQLIDLFFASSDMSMM